MRNESNTSREEYLYHNTEMLLKKYRSVVWSIEISVEFAEENFEREMGTSLDDFLEMSYSAGADLSGTRIQEQMRTMQRNKNMLSLINAAVRMLRKKPGCGELYYTIIYHTYLSETEMESISDLLEKIEGETYPMSKKTYFRKRKMAIAELSNILWGFISKEGSKLITEFDTGVTLN